ncbi:MAG TPA: TetR/AcrR family transcriptional regulator [Candidatus Eremiobacteraceae bacterium]|nr:TetR/AcrR family transcriptional regulator [Candidatus Eremiobacteraceae bacterium]
MRHTPTANGNRGGGATSARSPGRPRSEEARQAILRSALKLLGKNGFAHLTIEDVAAQASVGKATVYRWWPDKAALIADAFASSTTQKLHFPDTGSVCTDMSQQMRQLVKVFRSRRGRIVSALLGGGQSDRNLIAAFRERFLWPRRKEAYATLQRGIRRGELRKDVDMDLILDSLYGPIYMRFLIRHDRLTPDFVDHLCELILGGTQPRRKHRAQHTIKRRLRIAI